MATSEITPFAKTSPIADLLSEEVLGMIELGHDVRVVIPKYGHVS